MNRIFWIFDFFSSFFFQKRGVKEKFEFSNFFEFLNERVSEDMF
tara:strand:+ start:392 stop:523 length:132 start_codon:yes stop_codon:yes gene_type:complete